MYLDELLKCAYISTDAPTEDEIVLLLQGCNPQIDHHLLVKKSDFEEVLMRNRATDPTSEAIMIAIGKAKHEMSDPIWGVLLQQESVVNRFTTLCNAEAELALGHDTDAEPPAGFIEEERVPDFDIPINPGGVIEPPAFEGSALEEQTQDGFSLEPPAFNEPLQDGAAPEGSLGDTPPLDDAFGGPVFEPMNFGTLGDTGGPTPEFPSFDFGGTDVPATPADGSGLGATDAGIPRFEDFPTEPDMPIKPAMTGAEPNNFGIPDCGDGMSLYLDNPASHMYYNAEPVDSEAEDAPLPGAVEGVASADEVPGIEMGAIGEPGAFDSPDYPGAIEHMLGDAHGDKGTLEEAGAPESIPAPEDVSPMQGEFGVGDTPTSFEPPMFAGFEPPVEAPVFDVGGTPPPEAPAFEGFGLQEEATGLTQGVNEPPAPEFPEVPDSPGTADVLYGDGVPDALSEEGIGADAVPASVPGETVPEDYEEPVPPPPVEGQLEPERTLESDNNQTVQFIRKSFTLFYSLAKQHSLETILRAEGLDAATFCANVLQEFPSLNHQYTTSSAQPGSTESRCALDLIQALQLEAEEAALSGDNDRAEVCVTPVFKLIYKE